VVDAPRAGRRQAAGALNAAGAARGNAVPAHPIAARAHQEDGMEDHVYRVIEITGSSQTSIEEAIQTAVTRASKTLRNLRWFEVIQTRGQIEGGKVSYYQAVLKLGFTVEDA
jgi:dodecin